MKPNEVKSKQKILTKMFKPRIKLGSLNNLISTKKSLAERNLGKGFLSFYGKIIWFIVSDFQILCSYEILSAWNESPFEKLL